MASEPDDSNDDDKDAFDERGNGVANGGDEREENEGEDILGKMENAIEKKLEGEVDGILFCRGSRKQIIIGLEKRRE